MQKQICRNVTGSRNVLEVSGIDIITLRKSDDIDAILKF